MAEAITSVEHAMVRVGVRDMCPVAWRMAVGFARPDRSRAPIRILAVAMAPKFVLITLLPGTPSVTCTRGSVTRTELPVSKS